MDRVGDEMYASHPIPAAWSARARATIRRAPNRSERTPEIGAASTGIAVHGRVRRPAWNGE